MANGEAGRSDLDRLVERALHDLEFRQRLENDTAAALAELGIKPTEEVVNAIQETFPSLRQMASSLDESFVIN